MAETKINSLVDRIVRILKKNDGLSGLFFKDVGSIRVLNMNSNELITFPYDPSDIEGFFDAYESAIEKRAILEQTKR